MLNKLGLLAIIKDHIGTLRNHRTNKLYFPDIFLFFIFPLIISLLLIGLKVLLNDTMANALITSFSVFAALLFNLLLLVYDIAGKSFVNPDHKNKQDLKKEILRQIYINISFCIIVCIYAIVVLIFYFLKIKDCVFFSVNICSLPPMLSFLVYYISGLFILTLFMVLKRIYKLLKEEFET
jgi:hypothetical protein